MKRRGLGAGSVSLMLILAVLCLTVFAMLTLSSAQADKKLSDKLAQSVQDYYAADSAATEVLAGLKNAAKNGEEPETVNGIDLYRYEENGESYIDYSCKIDENRELAVTIKCEGDRLYIEKWQESELGEWSPDENIEVWTGK